MPSSTQLTHCQSYWYSQAHPAALSSPRPPIYNPSGFCPVGCFPPIRSPPGFSESGLSLSSLEYAFSYFATFWTRSSASPFGLPIAPVTAPRVGIRDLSRTWPTGSPTTESRPEERWCQGMHVAAEVQGQNQPNLYSPCLGVRLEPCLVGSC